MGVTIKHKTNPTPPMESVTLTDSYGYRTVTVRPTSSQSESMLTVQCTGRAREGMFKFAATRGDILSLGKSLVALAQGE